MIKNEFILDIETTGLFPVEEDDFVTCIGVYNHDIGVRQFTASAELFRSKPFEAEFKLLKEFSEFCSETQVSKIYTYNGENFDIPYLEKQYSSYKSKRISSPIPFKSHVDIFDAVKKLSKRWIAKDMAVRKFANIYYPPSIPAAYIANAYRNRIITDEEHTLMLAHNAIDVTYTSILYDKLLLYPVCKEILLGEE